MKKLITLLAATTMLVGLASCGNKGPSYTVLYDGHGNTSGEAPEVTTPYASGDTVTVEEPGSLAKDQYSFVCWNTESDGSGESYLPGATFEYETPTVLYAQWEPNTYTVTYNGNVAGVKNVPSDPSTYVSGESAVVLSGDNMFSLANTFVGWNLQADGSGKMYYEGDSIAMNSNVTLYAVWETMNWFDGVNHFLKYNYGVTADFTSLNNIVEEFDCTVVITGDAGEGTYVVTFYDEETQSMFGPKRSVSDELMEAVYRELFQGGTCWSFRSGDRTKFESSNYFDGKAFGKFNNDLVAPTYSVKAYGTGNTVTSAYSKITFEFGAERGCTPTRALNEIYSYINNNGCDSLLFYDDEDFKELGPKAYFVDYVYEDLVENTADDLSYMFDGEYDRDYNCVSFGPASGTAEDLASSVESELLDYDYIQITPFMEDEDGDLVATFTDEDMRVQLYVDIYSYYGIMSFCDIYLQLVREGDKELTGVTLVTNSFEDSVNSFTSLIDKRYWETNNKVGDIFGNFFQEKAEHIRDGKVISASYSDYVGSFSVDFMFDIPFLFEWPTAKLDTLYTAFTNKLPEFPLFAMGETFAEGTSLYAFRAYDQFVIDSSKKRLDEQYADLCRANGNFNVEFVENYDTVLGAVADTFIITSKDVVSEKFICMEAFAYGDVTYFVAYMGKTWISEEINELTLGLFTTEIPQPAEKSWSIASISVPGELVVAFTDKFGETAAEDYFAEFDATKWDKNFFDEDGSITYQVITDEHHEIGGQDVCLGMQFYQTERQFVIFVFLTDAPQDWFPEEVAQVTSGFNTVVPQPADKKWNISSSSTATDLVLYTTSFAANAADTYAALLESTEEWNIEPIGETGNHYYAESKEVKHYGDFQYVAIGIHFYISTDGTEFVINVFKTLTSVTWMGPEISQFLAGAQFTETTVPVPTETDWYFSQSSSYTSNVSGYSYNGDETSPAAYAENFTPANGWESCDPDEKTGAWLALSAEKHTDEQGEYQLGVSFYWDATKETFNISVFITSTTPAAKIAFPVDKANGYFDTLGWSTYGFSFDSFAPVAALGNIWDVVDDTYNPDDYGGHWTLLLAYDGENVNSYYETICDAIDGVYEEWTGHEADEEECEYYGYEKDYYIYESYGYLLVETYIQSGILYINISVYMY